MRMEVNGDIFGCLLTAVLVLCALAPPVAPDCTRRGPCSCLSPDGIIDLSPLDGKGVAKFQDLPATTFPDDYWYSWNPCSSFSEVSGCSNVAGCQVNNPRSQGFPIGTQESADFQTDSSTGALTLNYKAADISGGVRYLIVQLVCDPSNIPGTLTVVGESLMSTYSMTLRSIYCCPQGDVIIITVTGGLSVGSIMVIVFVCLLVVYAALGVTVQKFLRKASGREIIPNYTFWAALPGVVKDGVMFTFTCGRKRGYDKA